METRPQLRGQPPRAHRGCVHAPACPSRGLTSEIATLDALGLVDTIIATLCVSWMRPHLDSFLPALRVIYVQWPGFDVRSADYLQRIALALACQDPTEFESPRSNTFLA